MMPDPPASDIDVSYAFCRQVARREAKNFYPSFLLLPTDRRRSMCALYAFLRRTDDIADGSATKGDRVAALDDWRAGLAAVVAGEEPTGPTWDGWAALADTVRRHAIPSRHLQAVIDGVASDLDPQPFATYDDLAVYCDRVASAVGLACLHIWGYHSDGGRAEVLAEACGRALQLTNILRDVGEDAREGRVYLPQEDLRRFDVTEAELTAGSASPALRRLLAFEARRAYDEYERALPLATLVAPRGRPVLAVIAGIYRALLDEIVRRDYDVLAGRVSVPGRRKAAVVARALAGRFVPVLARGVEARPLP